MAHNINSSRGEAALYLLKEKAWHGLGTVVSEAKSAEEVIKIAKLDYEVVKARVYASFLPKTHKIIERLEHSYKVQDKEGNTYILNRKGELVNNAYVTYRKDTYELLMSGSVVTDRYTIVQNKDAFDWIDSLMDSQNIIFETAGALGRGERVFIAAKLPSSYKIKGDKSEITKYLLFTNTHDGSGKIQVLFTPIRVVCNNTLTAALQGAANKYTIKHTKTAHAKLDMALEMLNVYNEYEELHIEAMNKLVDIPVSDLEAKKIIANSILSHHEYNLFESNNYRLNSIEEISSRKKNKVQQIYKTVLNGVGQDSNQGSAYWLYNGVVNYYQNVKTYENDETKLDCVTEGEGAKLASKIMSSLISV